MKTTHPTRKVAPVLLALVLLALPCSLPAEEAAKEKQRNLTPNQQLYDLNKDGRLSLEEAAAARAAAVAKAKLTRMANLQKYDANKDGKLDAAERATKKAEEKAAKEAVREAKRVELEIEKAEKIAARERSK